MTWHWDKVTCPKCFKLKLPPASANIYMKKIEEEMRDLVTTVREIHRLVSLRLTRHYLNKKRK